MNKSVFFCTSLSFTELLFALSKAPYVPAFSQLTKYFVAFQADSGHPFMPIIICSLTVDVSNLFLSAVW